MATLTDVRQALADALSSIYGMRVSATILDAPRPPVAMVYPDVISYDLNANRGADLYTFIVTVMVGRADDRSSQNNIDRFAVGPDSVKTAIERDRSLGGVVNTCRVVEMRNYQAIPIGDVTYLAVEFEVEVVV
jgi:hypothetical protein